MQLGAGQSWAPVAVSGVLLANLLPTTLLGPIAGVFVDRWDKRHTMLVMDAVRAVVIGLLLLDTGVVSWPGGQPPAGARIAAIYVAVIIATACQQFFGPSRMALIGDVVDNDDLARASGLTQVTGSLATIIGPPLAAPLLFAFGVQWALVINSLSFVLSFISIWLVHAPPAAHSVGVGEQGHAWREFQDGLRFFAGSRILVTLLATIVLVTLGAGALNVLDIFFVTQNLHTAASLYGWLSSAFGIGALVGGISASIMASRFRPALMFWSGMVLGGVMILAYSRLGSFVPALVVLALVGVVVSLVNVAVMPMILQVTPRELLGRVEAVITPASSLASVASIAGAGLLVSTVLHGFHASLGGLHFGPVDTILSGTGIIVLAGGVFAMIRLRGYGVEETPAHAAPEAVGQ